jgi:hypothetical protein
MLRNESLEKMMVSESKWTVEEAAGDFVRLLEAARVHGPQEIIDATGVYVLEIRDDHSKEDAARFLVRTRRTG